MANQPVVTENISDLEHGEEPDTTAASNEKAPDSWQRFKIIALVAKAVQRWQASINPKVDFRKRAPTLGESSWVDRTTGSSSNPRRFLSDPAPESSRVLSGRSRSGESGRLLKGTSGPPGQQAGVRKGPSHRGHMTSYLFKQLPEPKGMGSGRSSNST